MIEEYLAEIIFQIFLLVGIIFRTALPYVKKRAEAEQAGESITFDPKFGWTAFLGWLTAEVELAVIYAESPYLVATLPIRFAAIAGFFFGVGNNEIWNRILHRAPAPT